MLSGSDGSSLLPLSSTRSRSDVAKQFLGYQLSDQTTVVAAPRALTARTLLQADLFEIRAIAELGQACLRLDPSIPWFRGTRLGTDTSQKLGQPAVFTPIRATECWKNYILGNHLCWELGVRSAACKDV